MSTTANIGLNQADYVMINRTESSSSAISSETTSLTSLARSLTGGVEGRGERSATPSQGDNFSQGQNDGEGEHAQTSGVPVHKNGQTTNQNASHNHVTSESLPSKDVSKGGEGAMTYLSKETAPATPAGDGEVQLPAKQALAVLSNVRRGKGEEGG